MDSRFFKSYLPRTLFGRASLILILPIILLQLVVGTVFIQRHFEGVTTQMTRNIAREITLAIQVINTSPDADIAQARLNNLAAPLSLTLRLDGSTHLVGANRRLFFDLSGRALTNTLLELFGDEISVDLATDGDVVDFRVETEKGVLTVIIPRGRIATSNPHQLLVLMIFTSLLLIIVAVIFLRNQLRPALKLADAAEAFGKGRSLPYRPSGAEEIRRAGNAFLDMRSRLERQIEQRTQMLSGVSHDLRTPLTRMKLTLALADDLPEAAELGRDVDEMENMLDAFLNFARGDKLEETEAVDPVLLAEDVVKKSRRTGGQVSFACTTETPENTMIEVRPGAVTRALQNLVNNAMSHGTRARLTVRLLTKTCEFTVDDNGPGIPVADRELVLRPFARLDQARNQDKGGGVGLGLSIALDVARSHGGTLTLDSSTELGGLKACLRLPR